MRTAWSRALLVAVVALVPGLARADGPPTAWDRAKDPSAASRYAVHVRVQARLHDNVGLRADIDEAQRDAAAAILERADAAKSPDVRLRFDLGIVYLLQRRYKQAAEVLSSALAEAPDHPGAEHAWSRLAVACGRLGDHPCEKRAYDALLRLATEDAAREIAVLNLAETEMHLGNLPEAVAGYREASRLAGRLPQNITTPLAAWGLAVALDRSGDRVAAEREARFAREIERSMGHKNLLRSDEDVYFYPEYEIHWYEGLGAFAQAKAATSPTDAARLFRASEVSFAAYVRAAERDDRWLEIAKKRHAAAKAEREKAEKKARTVREPGDGDVSF